MEEVKLFQGSVFELSFLVSILNTAYAMEVNKK